MQRGNAKCFASIPRLSPASVLLGVSRADKATVRKWEQGTHSCTGLKGDQAHLGRAVTHLVHQYRGLFETRSIVHVL